MLGGIASQAAVAIERARLQMAEIEQQRVATELGVARNIQIGFLPDHAPQPSGYEIAAIWEPARQIGGDFYDFIPLKDDRLGIVVADVADKGIPAALYMALSRTTMRLVSTRNPSPSAALLRVNTAILDTTYSDLFVTVYYAILDPTTHHVTYASGGHGLALQASEDGVTFLRGRGTVLGVFSPIRVEEFDTDLAPGDYLVIYTDGVTDAVNAEMEGFGEGRLAALLEQHRSLSAQAMLDLIREKVHVWQGEAPSFDDFTLVVIKRKR
jgi:sigma-B regulation protein RsbU (phosphoserine phosphatase)